MFDQLKDMLSEDAYNALEEFRVTASLMGYEIEQDEDEELTFYFRGEVYIRIAFFIGLARIQTIDVFCNNHNSNKYVKHASSEEEQVELMEEIQNLLE